MASEEPLESQPEDASPAADGGREDFGGIRELAFNESTRWLDIQAVERQSLQVRAGILLTGVTAATAFVAGIALDGVSGRSVNDDPLLITAAVLYVLVGALCVFVLWPYSLQTVDDARVILGAPYGDFTLGQMHHQLAEFNARSAAKNWRWLVAFRVALMVAALLAVAEIVAWLSYLLWRT